MFWKIKYWWIHKKYKKVYLNDYQKINVRDGVVIGNKKDEKKK